MVMEVVHEEMAEGNMQCVSHPYKNSSPGGICAFCLQEKLGKLVSSSFPVALFPPSSSSSSPSFRSEAGAPISVDRNPPSYDTGTSNRRRMARAKLPFRLTRKNKRQDGAMPMGRNRSNSATFVFMRSKSIATPGKNMHFLDENHKRGFWSFLYTPRDSRFKKNDKQLKVSDRSSSLKENRGGGEMVLVEENMSPDEAAVDSKVSRSRSIGCGSRSFSGDFFEIISTGFSDCTLRRAESQRECKSKARSVRRNSGEGNGQDCIKQRAKCGRIFSGFMITSSSSSSSSSNLVSCSAEDSTITMGKRMVPQSHYRSRGWGWNLPSPMRAFSKPRSGKTDNTDSNNVPPKIPSLLAVSC